MKRHIPGLLQPRSEPDELPEGLFLVQVDQARYRWHSQKPFFTLRFRILDPGTFSGHLLSGRLYCSARALWKLNWFLRDFGYDTDLLGREEVDEKALVGLRGVVRVSYTRMNGHAYRNLEGFAPAAEWDELSGQGETVESNHGHDL
jgi:hypothetical protein